MTFDLLLIGFGHVARRFATILHERRARLQRDYSLEARVVGIATKRHGRLYAPRGLDAVALVSRVERGGNGSPATPRPAPRLHSFET